VTCEHVVPRRKSAVLGFSIAFGAFLSNALLLRALRGFLGFVSFICFQREVIGEGITFVATSCNCSYGIEELKWLLSQGCAVRLSDKKLFSPQSSI
jgi:hypothetical protein